RRAMITGVRPFDADTQGRVHLVDLEYTDGIGVETDQLLWEVEPDTRLLESTALPDISGTAPMEAREFDAMLRAARWSALTPTLPFSGLAEDRPPLAAPLYGAIQPEAYQLVPVLRALEMPRVALMLADAVGLGKTIQAGMVIRELMLRRRIRRIIILCPASLRVQWKEELEEKFSLPFEIVDRPQTAKLQRELGLDASPWRSHERIITSFHYLKQPDVLESFRNAAEPEQGRLAWDLLVVDEVHNLAPAAFGADSDLSKMLQQIAPWFEHRLFLTATPHNGHTRSFSGLLEILDPVRFTKKSPLDPEDRKRVADTVIRRLKSTINGWYTRTGDAPRFSERVVQALPTLRPGAHERSLGTAFSDFRKALRRATRGAPHQDRTACNFSLEVLQKRLLSGPWAFGQSWLALEEGLAEFSLSESLLRPTEDEDPDNDAELESRQRHTGKLMGAWLRRYRTSVAEEMAAITKTVQSLGLSRVPPDLEPEARQRAIADAATKVAADARLKILEDFIESRLRAGAEWRPHERLVLFTEYLATLDYLRARLLARYGAGDWLLCLFGGMNDADRANMKRRFNDPAGPARVLLATDAAGEGLNLQRACRLLIHWDIPWNPGKMEQRNGRIDRHGQERDVEIFHFDSTDDSTMRFLGKVLHKRSQTREDSILTDDLFARAILSHFEQEEDAEVSVVHLDRSIALARDNNREAAEDLVEGTALPGAEDQARLEALKAEIDLSPQSLKESLETVLALDAGRPRFKSEKPGRERLVKPVPAAWKSLLDESLGPVAAGYPALVFDPTHFLHLVGEKLPQRRVYVPEADARLMHLGHALYHQLMSTFARYRFPGGPRSATRWTVRQGFLSPQAPAQAEALILLTVEELAVNQLREPCHHQIRTIALPYSAGRLGEPLPHQPASFWNGPTRRGDEGRAREIWEEVDRDLKNFVRSLEKNINESLSGRLHTAGRAVAEIERS
ncbi:MAG TPA: SNF2-related protein, partial [Myxococcota bacterium]|nr:SNF2-related protein [Myxococcota bacterium]